MYIVTTITADGIRTRNFTVESAAQKFFNALNNLNDPEIFGVAWTKKG